jgi:hypothetical protein
MGQDLNLVHRKVLQPVDSRAELVMDGEVVTTSPHHLVMPDSSLP